MVVVCRGSDGLHGTGGIVLSECLLGCQVGGRAAFPKPPVNNEIVSATFQRILSGPR